MIVGDMLGPQALILRRTIGSVSKDESVFGAYRNLLRAADCVRSSG
jgi:hypothetical protein